MVSQESIPAKSIGQGLPGGQAVCDHSAPQGGASFASVARKLSIWTTNLLASAIVLVLGLAFGWQVLAWWRDQPLPTGTALSQGPDIAPFTAGHEFATKHGSLLVRQVRGDSQAVLAAMRGACLEMSSDERGTDDLAPPVPSELRLLEQLRKQPCLEEPGDLALYQPPGKELMIAAVNRERTRIVGWCFALPAGDGAWSLYRCRPPSVSPIQTSPAAGARP
jgi:hypothetical protein